MGIPSRDAWRYRLFDAKRLFDQKRRQGLLRYRMILSGKR